MDEKKQRLLVVDDSKVIRVTARKILKDHFETIEAADGQEAWDILTGDKPVSLVVSDLTMPNLDGFGLLEKIRGSHLPQVRDLPVIIITGANDTETTMEKARSAGATDFIGKPFDSVHLLARTQAHANSHTAANTLRQENSALKDSSTTDELTGLVNESAFMERGYQDLSFAIRHDSSLCLYRIEIDYFGDLYRQHGQEFASSLTRTVGEILSSAIRVEDTAARIGAARFSLLLPGMEMFNIRSLAERIHSELGRRTFKAGNTRCSATISIGVASPDIRCDTRLDELLVVADQRLGHAMATGGNQTVFEDPDSYQVPETVEAVPAPGVMEMAAAPAPAREPEMAASAPYNPFLDENMEIEEIELSSSDSSNGTAAVFGNGPAQEQAEPQCLSPEEPVSSTFAGPVPETGNIDLSGASNAGEADCSAGQESLCPRAPANDTGNGDEAEFTPATQAGSTVTALPLDIHPVGNAANEAPDRQADLPEPAVDAGEKPKPRRGILRRLMSALFGRRPRRRR